MSAKTRYRIKATFPNGDTYLGDYITDLRAWWEAEPLREADRLRAEPALQSRLAPVPVDANGDEVAASLSR